VNPRGIVGAVSAVLAPLDVQRDEQRDEVSRVTYARVPLFWRDEHGRPRVLGVPFPRWVRGERKK
jgi:hypothetical protein